MAPGGDPGASQADASLDTVDHKRFERVWAVITEIGLEERHFNTLQADYRKLASTWLLATFAGIGFVISTPELALPLHRLLLISAIGAAAAVGLLLLWIIDILVYHQLLLACFEAGLKLEERYGFLPQVRTGMRAKSGHGTGVAPQVVMFYLVAIGASLIISGGALTAWLLPQSTWLAWWFIAGWLTLVGAALWAIRFVSGRVERTEGDAPPV